MANDVYDREQGEQNSSDEDDQLDFYHQHGELDNPDEKDSQASGDSSDPRSYAAPADLNQSEKPYSTAGNAPTAAEFGPEQLKQAEEQAVGQPTASSSSSTTGGKVNYTGGSSSSGSSSLSTGTNAGKVNYNTSNKVPESEKSLYNSTSTAAGRVRFKNLLATRRRKAIAGGGLVGSVVALVFMLTFASGPLQLVHFAELLKQFHLSSQGNAQDGRFLHDMKVVRGYKTGTIQRTRLSFVSNRVADKFELKLNGVGLETVYSGARQVGVGWKIERDKFPGLSDEEIIAQLEKKYPGGSVVRGSDIPNRPSSLKADDLVLQEPSGTFEGPQGLAFRYNLMKSTGLNWLASAEGTHLLATRDFFSLDPISRIIGKGKNRIEQEALDKKNANTREQTELSGETEARIISTQTQVPTDQNGNPDPTALANAEEEVNQANEIIAESTNLDTSLGKGGGADAVDSAESKLFDAKSGLFAAGAIYAAACIAQNIDANAPEIKNSEVIKPLIRLAMYIISMGDQIESGQGVDPNFLNGFSSQLTAVDQSNKQTGTKTSWYDAQTIQADLGNKNGIAPDPTLQHATDSITPFHFLNQEPIATPLSAICSPPAQIFGTVISFLGGGIVEGLQGLILGGLQSEALKYAFTQWLGNTPVNSSAQGADLGNYAEYGAKLGGNDQAVMAGGRQLSNNEAGQLTLLNNGQYQSEFNNQSIAYRLFNKMDPRSAISQLVDSSSTSASHNIASLAKSIFNVGHIFGSLGHLFSGQAQAATTGFDYGIPTYGFSVAELNNASTSDPIANGNAVADLLDANATSPVTGKTYVQMADDCFGITIAKDSNGLWNATSDAAKNNSLEIYNTNSGSQNHYDPACADTTDPNWLKVRFFIFDTETMNAMDCYFTNDNDSCNDSGLGGTSATTPQQPPTSGPPTGTAQQLAQQLVPYVNDGTIKCVGTGGDVGCSDITNTANNVSIKGGLGCTVDALNANLLGMLLKLVQLGHTFSLSALCSDHHNDGTGGHATGQAADFNTIDGTFMGPNDAPWDSTKIAAATKLDQDIASFMPKTTGFGQVGADSSGVTCHPSFDFLSSFTTFGDTCNHQHVQVAG